MSVLKDYPKELRDQVAPPSTMYRNGYSVFANYPECLCVPWRKKDEHEFVSFYSCDEDHILLHNFQLRHNFTAVHAGRQQHLHVDGMIEYSVFYGAQAEVINLVKFVFLDSNERDILYCDTDLDKNKRLIDWNIFRPFKTEVWVLKVVVLVFIILVHSSRKVTLGSISKNLHIIFGTLLKQEGAQRSGILVLLSFFVFFYFSLYENFLTSTLIAPMTLNVKRDIYELFLNGYRFLLPAWIADPELATFVEAEEKALSWVYAEAMEDASAFFKQHNRSQDLTKNMFEVYNQEYTLFQTYHLLGDPANKTAQVINSNRKNKALRLRNAELLLRNHPCFYTTNSLGIKLIFVSFNFPLGNLLIHELQAYKEAGMFHIWDEWIYNLQLVGSKGWINAFMEVPEYIAFLDFPLLKVILKYFGILYIVSISALVLEILLCHTKLIITKYYISNSLGKL